MSKETEVDESGTEQDTGEAVGTGNDARLALLAKIADNNEQGLEEDLADVHDDGSTSEFKASKEEASEKAEGEQKDEEEEEQPAADSTPQKHKLKVNGKELELTLDEIIARAQKVESADEYLRDAAEAKKQATAKPTEDPAKGPSEEDVRRQQEADDLALVRAIQMGTEEEAAAALRKLREQASSARPSLNRDDVSRTIDERLAFNTAISEFARDFEEVWNDPILKDIAFRRDAQLLQDGDKRNYSERYKAIGEEIRGWKKSLVGDTKPADDLTNKEQRKASAPKAPAAASAKAKPAAKDEDDGDEDTSSVIANMAKSRGGPQWMRG